MRLIWIDLYATKSLAGLAIVFGFMILLPRFRAKWEFLNEMQRAQEAFSSLEIPWNKSA